MLYETISAASVHISCIQQAGTSCHLLQHVCCNLEVIVHDDPVKVMSILGLNLATLLHQVV